MRGDVETQFRLATQSHVGVVETESVAFRMMGVTKEDTRQLSCYAFDADDAEVEKVPS
jgi:hypothetical protein